MSIEAWASHLESRENPMLIGNWGDTPWEFYEYDQELPDTLAVRTAMCVPVCSLDPNNPQVTLTLNLRRGGFEVPGGHRDPLKGRGIEPARWAAVREVREETGLRLRRLRRLLPFGYIEARNNPDSGYPPLNYMQFFGTYTHKKPGRITDPEVDGAGVFTLDALRTMAERGAVQQTELKLVCVGVRAVLRNRGLPDEQIAMP